MWPPRSFRALPAPLIYEASPKAISRRTSYIRVRLEFLPYPQVIPAFFNRRLVRASIMFYHNFTLPMDRSPGFGSAPSNSFALFRLAFASAPNLKFLTLLEIATRRSVLQKVRDRASHAFSACKHRVSGSFSLPSRGSFHLSLTVLCAIGRQEVFSLGRWSSLLPAGFHVPCGTLGSSVILSLRLRGCHPLWPSFPAMFRSRYLTYDDPQPHPTVVG